MSARQRALAILCLSEPAAKAVQARALFAGLDDAAIDPAEQLEAPALAVFSRAFGADTGGNSQAAPATALSWTAGTTRHAGTFVIKPAVGGGGGGAQNQLVVAA